MNTLKKQLFRFLITGSSAVIIDSLIYYLLLNIFSTEISKAISFICGAAFAFVLNRLWTFNRNKQAIEHLWRFIILYMITLTINVMVNKGCLLILPEQLTLAFLTATGTSTVLNFIGQKWWVFAGNETVNNRSMLQ
jgi:putative flippase GtrA